MARATPEQLAQVRKLHERGIPLRQIAVEVGLHRETCRLYLNPEARIACYAHQRATRATYKATRNAAGLVEDYPFQARQRAERDAIKQRIPPDTRDLTAIICGDPLPGRRALDRVS